MSQFNDNSDQPSSNGQTPAPLPLWPLLAGPRATLTLPAVVQALHLPLSLEKLLAKIMALSEGEIGCYIGDTYLSQVIGMSRTHTWRLVKELARRELIALDYVPSPLDPCHQMRRLIPQIALPPQAETGRYMPATAVSSPSLPEPLPPLACQASAPPLCTVPASVPLPLRGIFFSAAAAESGTGAKACPACTESEPQFEPLPAPSVTPDAGQEAQPLPAAAEKSRNGDGEEQNASRPNAASEAARRPLTAVLPGPGQSGPAPAPEGQAGAEKLRACGVDPPVAVELARLRPLAQIEGALARVRREEKGVGWVVKCLREDWAVAPARVHGAGSDSRDVITTRAYREELRTSGTWQEGAADRAQYEAMREQLRRQLAAPQLPAGLETWRAA
jgi:hypothetical protein